MDWRNGVRNICRVKEEGYIEVLRYPWGGLVLSFDLRRPYLGHKDSMFAVRRYIGDGTATSFK